MKIAYTAGCASAVLLMACSQFAAATHALTDCPVNGHDIVVNNVIDLRHAVSNSLPGTLIGIDGIIDTGADGQDDVLVSSPGVTITCATDGAGLVGAPKQAVLWVQASDVTVAHLNVVASQMRGIAFGDLLGTGVTADRSRATHNNVQCELTCILFESVNDGLIQHNTVNSGASRNAIAMGNSDQVEVSDNRLANCIFCVLVQESSRLKVLRNHYQDCGEPHFPWRACNAFLYSNDIIVRENNIQNSPGPGFASFESRNLSLTNNNMQQCSNEAGCVRLATGDNVTVSNNTVTDSQVALQFVELDNATIKENNVSGCELAIFFNAGVNAKVVDNTVTCDFQMLRLDELTARNNDVQIDAQYPPPGEVVDPAFKPDIDFALNSNARIHDNTFANGSVRLSGNQQLTIKNNRISNVQFALMGNQQLTMKNNSVNGCLLQSSCISSVGDSEVSIEDNELKGAIGGFGEFDEFGGTAIAIDSPFGFYEVKANEIIGSYLNGIQVNGQSAFEGVPPIAPSVEIKENEMHIDGGAFFEPGVGITLTNVSDGVITGNTIAFPPESRSWGLALSGEVFAEQLFFNGVLVDEFRVDNPVRHNLIKDNRISGTEIGIRLNGACSNTLKENDFGADLPVVYELRSGGEFKFVDEYTGDVFRIVSASGGTGNNLFGGVDGGDITEILPEPPSVVIGNGYVDCDGDGSGDPNIVISDD